MIYDMTRARRSDGRFFWQCTFRRTTQPITYRLRVAIPASGLGGYPYTSAASPARTSFPKPSYRVGSSSIDFVA
jgi:hypothetical protein